MAGGCPTGHVCMRQRSAPTAPLAELLLLRAVAGCAPETAARVGACCGGCRHGAHTAQQQVSRSACSLAQRPLAADRSLAARCQLTISAACSPHHRHGKGIGAGACIHAAGARDAVVLWHRLVHALVKLCMDNMPAGTAQAAPRCNRSSRCHSPAARVLAAPCCGAAMLCMHGVP